MIITYHGKQFFKIQQGDTTIAINPLSKDNTLGIKPVKFGASITLCSVRHPNYSGFENTEYNGKEPFKIYGPGSYEVEGNTFVGFQSKAIIDGSHYINTVYFFNLENISFCFLGDIFDIHLDQKIKEFVDTVDVLFVPIGGEGTLDALQASKVLKFFGPKVIIPMDYGKDREKASLENFLKEMSAAPKPEPKFVFKKSDLEKFDHHIVVLEQQ